MRRRSRCRHTLREVIRVVVADDEALVRGGMRLVLESDEGIRVVGEAADGREAIDLVSAQRPDVAVMDVRMPTVDGIEATRTLQERVPATRILVVTTFHLDEYVLEALRAGASGFLLKDSAPEALADAVRTVAAGDSLLSPAVTGKLVEHFVRQPAPDAGLSDRLGELSEREAEVMRLVARGLTNAEVGAELHLSEGTVKTHVTSVLSKLGLRNRAQVVVAAYESGLVAPGTNPLS
jgi:DNA-binding NarL/FixJ family response regulator